MKWEEFVGVPCFVSVQFPLAAVEQKYQSIDAALHIVNLTIANRADHDNEWKM